jgi:hypothetical protein
MTNRERALKDVAAALGCTEKHIVAFMEKPLEVGLPYTVSQRELVLDLADALRDHMWPIEASCQFGLVDRCICDKHIRERSNALLKRVTEGK